MTDTATRTATLVTGASGGIGLELARQCAARGQRVVLVARGAEALQQLAVELTQRHGVEAIAMPLDLTDPSAPEELFTRLTAANLVIDTLINNAGFATYGPFVEADIRRELQEIQLNVVTLTHLTRLLLPEMVRRRSGRILNVASTAAFLPGPLMAVYYATKAYVLSFSEAIGEELIDTGVTVTALCPGPTRTGFQRRAAMEDSKLVANPAAVMDAASVARAGYEGLLAGKRIVIPGFTNQLLPLAVRVLPRTMATRLAKKAQERRTPGA